MSIYTSRLNVEALLGVTTDAAAEFVRVPRESDQALINDCFLYICVHFDYPQYPALSFPPLGQDFGIQHLDLWTSQKWDLDEVEKAMFQGLEWHSQLIFGLWTS